MCEVSIDSFNRGGSAIGAYLVGRSLCEQEAIANARRIKERVGHCRCPTRYNPPYPLSPSLFRRAHCRMQRRSPLLQFFTPKTFPFFSLPIFDPLVSSSKIDQPFDHPHAALTPYKFPPSRLSHANDISPAYRSSQQIFFFFDISHCIFSRIFFFFDISYSYFSRIFFFFNKFFFNLFHTVFLKKHEYSFVLERSANST